MKLNLKFGSSVLLAIALPSISIAAPQKGKFFDRAMIVIFENTNYSATMKQPYFAKLAKDGANFSNFLAITHPSQGNYVALTSGSLNGVRNDKTVDIDSTNIADLLEAKGLTWKVYAEGYPGGCFKGTSTGGYVRKHNPFISYLNIQRNPARCANIVPAAQLDIDIAQNKVPNYMFYVPDVRNDGHDTGVAFADKWYSKWLPKYLSNPQFVTNTVVVSTFDESGASARNQIYTNIIGSNVNAGDQPGAVNLYSLLKLFEENWSLGSFGRDDASAVPMPNIWK